MKCPTCERGGVTSTVYDEGRSSTCMGWMTYWDEKGMEHAHDPNTHRRYYRCSRGHHFMEIEVHGCRAAGCTLHPNQRRVEELPSEADNDGR